MAKKTAWHVGALIGRGKNLAPVPVSEKQNRRCTQEQSQIRNDAIINQRDKKHTKSK